MGILNSSVHPRVRPVGTGQWAVKTAMSLTLGRRHARIWPSVGAVLKSDMDDPQGGLLCMEAGGQGWGALQKQSSLKKTTEENTEPLDCQQYSTMWRNSFSYWQEVYFWSLSCVQRIDEISDIEKCNISPNYAIYWITSFCKYCS